MRDLYHEAQLENERILDERDAEIEKVRFECDEQVRALENQFAQELESTRRDAAYQADGMAQELDIFRRAATGDPCGWREVAIGDAGKRYENAHDGETSEQKPAPLALAQAVRHMEEVQKDEKMAEKLERRARTAETKRRQIEVELNDAKSKSASQRVLLNKWGDGAKTIRSLLNAMSESVDAVCSRIEAAGDELREKAERVSSTKGTAGVRCVNFNSRLRNAVRAFKKTNVSLLESNAKGRKLESEVSGLGNELGKARSELDYLRNSLDNAVAIEVEPMRAQVAKARDDLANEKVLRMVERQQIAAVWPPDHLIPVALRRYATLDRSQVDKLKRDALAAEADAEIKREIRRRVADAARWSQVTDDYGRQYYAHADTGEASWDPPEAMMYEPPPGRDALGNVVVASVEEEGEITEMRAADGVARDEQVADKSSEMPTTTTTQKVSPWIEIFDDWGQKRWKNRITGETSKDEPRDDTLTRDTAQEGNPDEFSTDEDEREPTAADGAQFFATRLKDRRQRAERRRRRAILAARRAIGFLEEEFLHRQGDDAPLSVDIQAVKELAAGDEGWIYQTRQTRKILEAQAKADRLKAEREAEAIELERKSKIQRALEERRKVTGFKRTKKVEAPLPLHSEPQSESQLRFTDADSTQILEEPKRRSLVGSDAYHTLLGAADGFDDSNDQSIEELRQQLEHNVSSLLKSMITNVSGPPRGEDFGRPCAYSSSIRGNISSIA